MQFTYSSCAPSLGLEISIRPNCREYNDEVAAFLAQDHEIATVFLVAAYGRAPGARRGLLRGHAQGGGLLLGAGKRVVLVYPIPTASASVPRTLARYAAAGAALDSFTIDEAEYLRKNAFAFQLLDSISDANVVHVLPHQRLCDGTAARSRSAARRYTTINSTSASPAPSIWSRCSSRCSLAPPATAASLPAASPPRSRGNPAPPPALSPSHRARGR